MGINKNKQSVAFAFAAVGGCSLNCLVPSQAVEQAEISLSDPSPWTRTHLPKRSSNAASLNPKSKLPLHYKPVAQNSRHLVQILGKKKKDQCLVKFGPQAGPCNGAQSHVLVRRCSASAQTPKGLVEPSLTLHPQHVNVYVPVFLAPPPHPSSVNHSHGSSKKKNAHEMG